jgi:cytochrome c-type biogenesis protein CcmH
MIIFWILSAGLMALALVFVALPLLRPEPPAEAPEQDALNLVVFKQRLQELDADQAAGFLEAGQYAAARRDLERDLLRDIPGDSIQSIRRGSGGQWMALILAIAVPAAALWVYDTYGHREIIAQMDGSLAAPGGEALIGHDGEELPPLEVLVERLAERLAEDPSNVDGWLMIGRTYFTMRQPDRALAAVTKAYELAPDRSDVMLAYAEALAANAGGALEGKPAELIDQVLTKEPDNTSARWLAGMLYYQRGQFTAAATAWQGVLDVLDPASDDAADMRQIIAEARARASGATGAPAVGTEAAGVDASAAPASDAASPPVAEATPAPTAAQATGGDASAGGALVAEVSLDAAISAGAAPDDVVYVFARAAGGPPMPLAVQRIQVKDLPTRVTLDDSMGMMPQMKLSAFPQVMVGARVAKSGLATPQSGDLEGEVGPIDQATRTQVAVSIDRVRP